MRELLRIRRASSAGVRASALALAAMSTSSPARQDAGHPRASARDLELLRLIGEHYAVTLPQLARLMARSEHHRRHEG